MTYLATLTQKGQVTIPIDVRRFLNINSGDQVAFVKTKNKIVVQTARSFLDLKGSIKTSRKFSDKTADAEVLQAAAQNYGQKTAGS